MKRSTPNVYELAHAAAVEERIVRRFLAGEPICPVSERRIQQALEALDLPDPTRAARGDA